MHTLRTSISTILFIVISVTTYGQDLFPYRQGDKWGYCDHKKNIVISPKYESAEIFLQCNIATVQLHGKFGFINKAGKEITPIQFDRRTFFWYDKTYVWLNNKVGIIDTFGHTIIPIIYDDIDFTETIVGLKQNDKWCLYHTNGKKISKTIYDGVNPHSYRLIAVKIKDKWGFIDQAGETKIKPRFETVGGFSRIGMSAIKLNGKWGFVDVAGKIVIKPVYDEVRNYQNNRLCWVKQNKKWGLIDEFGKTVAPFNFDIISYFKEGLAAVEKDRKWGFIDSGGNMVIPFQYDMAFEFSEGLAEVCMGDTCAYINKKNEKIIPFQYQTNFGGEFNEGLAEVKKNGKYGFIDTSGRIVIPILFDTPADYNSFELGVGMLLMRDETDNDDEKFASRKFYFDKYGTMFYE